MPPSIIKLHSPVDIINNGFPQGREWLKWKHFPALLWTLGTIHSPPITFVPVIFSSYGPLGWFSLDLKVRLHCAHYHASQLPRLTSLIPNTLQFLCALRSDGGHLGWFLGSERLAVTMKKRKAPARKTSACRRGSFVSQGSIKWWNARLVGLLPHLFFLFFLFMFSFL